MIFGILGYGRFGKLWAQCLEPFGEVRVYDPKNDKTRRFNTVEEVLATDFLFVLVPIGRFETVCKSLAQKIPANTVVVDACSVKVHPAEVMQKVFPKKQALIATHPLFGPDSVERLGLKGRKMVLCPLRAETKQVQALKKIFQKMGLEIFECTPKEHDEQMAKSQALVHFLGRGLAGLKLKEQDLYTPDYEALRRIDSVVNNDTWELFFDMQRLNPYTEKMRKTLLQKLRALHHEIEKPTTIQSARKAIDQLDQELVELLSQRMELSRFIGTLKEQSGTAIFDPKREAELAKLHRHFAETYGLDPVFVDLLFERIFSYSRTVQHHKKTSQPKQCAPSTTVAINGIAQNLRAEGQRIYNLSAGEPMVDTAHFYKKAVDKALALNNTHYPPAAGIPELRSAASHWMNTYFGTNYSAQNCLVTGGGKFAIHLTLLSLLQAGDDVLIPSPHYLSYPPMVEMVGARPILVPGDPKKGWKITAKELEKAHTPRTRLLILNSGNNPTGILYSQKEIASFLEFAERHELWILSDEVYSGLVYDGLSYASCATPEKTRNRVAVIQSASKTFGMTGWRLGFLYGPDDLIRSCEALQSQILTSTSIVSQWAGVSAFAQAEHITPLIRSAMQERRDLFYKELEKGLGKKLTRPSSAFYAFFPLSLFGETKLSDVEWCAKLLKEAHVAAVPGSPFGRPDYVRMSFGETPEELKEAVKVLCKWVKKSRS